MRWWCRVGWRTFLSSRGSSAPAYATTSSSAPTSTKPGPSLIVIAPKAETIDKDRQKWIEQRHTMWLINTGLSSRVVSISDCGVRGPRFESHRRRLCLSRQLLRYTALGTGCAHLLQCLGRLSLPPSVER